MASFAYSPADKNTPYLLSLLQPLTDLKKKLLKEFAGRTMTMHEVYYEYEHLARTPFIKKNYKQVLLELEDEEKITAEPHRKNTFADHVKVTFPKGKK